ncbi:MAG: CesT family type III secretion system chaperone [Puniceicoccales bacterium]|nr:CesT family type III secretion system chaperone [Puniceicoccales bacterium]
MLDNEALLKEVGSLLRMPLKLDPKTCRCTLRDKASKQEYFIELPRHSSYLYLYSVLLRASPEQDSANFYRSLLEMNLFGLKTDTGSLSIDPASRSILLHLSFPMEFLTPQLMVNLLTNFTATAKKLGVAVEDQLLISNKDAQKRRVHYSPAEGMDKKNPGSSMRVIRI